MYVKYVLLFQHILTRIELVYFSWFSGLPKKIGQCPYLIPMNSGSCDFECKVDSNCNGTEKCCSNGCGTQCTEPVLMTGMFYELL